MEERAEGLKPLLENAVGHLGGYLKSYHDGQEICFVKLELDSE